MFWITATEIEFGRARAKKSYYYLTLHNLICWLSCAREAPYVREIFAAIAAKNHAVVLTSNKAPTLVHHRATTTLTFLTTMTSSICKDWSEQVCCWWFIAAYLMRARYAKRDACNHSRENRVLVVEEPSKATAFTVGQWERRRRRPHRSAGMPLLIYWWFSCAGELCQRNVCTRGHKDRM